MSDVAVRERIGSVVAEVVRQTVHDAGADGLVVLDDGSPEAGLAVELCTRAVGAEQVVTVAPPDDDVLSATLSALESVSVDRVTAGREVHRLRARLAAAARGALLVHPVNKTALLLGGSPPPEPLLPLGDLYASQVVALTGEWSAPDPIVRLAETAGGIEVLDAALTRWAEERMPLDEALRSLPGEVGTEVSRRLEAGRFARRRIGLIPKLGARTLGIDLLG